MAPQGGPLVPRRRLGAELKQLREKAKLRLEDAAHRLECSTSKVSRLEAGKGVPKARDVRDLLTLYGVEDQRLRDRLVRLAGDGRRTSWWEGLAPNLPTVVGTYIDLEAEASTMSGFNGFAIHGLAQTEDYAHAILKASFLDSTPDDLDERVQVRMQRQKRFLEREDPMTVRMVVDESALRRRLLPADGMRDQLRKLVEFSTRNDVSIRVFPFALGGHIAIQCTYSIFQFDDDLDRNVVGVELSGGDHWYELDKDVAKYLSVFNNLFRKCPNEVDSRDFMNRVLRED